MVEGNSDLHHLVEAVSRVTSQKHHLIMLGEVVVRNRDGSGRLGHVDQAIGTTGKKVVVDPDVVRAIDRDCITVGFPSISDVVGAASNDSGPCLLDVVDVHLQQSSMGFPVPHPDSTLRV